MRAIGARARRVPSGIGVIRLVLDPEVLLEPPDRTYNRIVKDGKPRADTQHAVDGTFVTILGREAAYRRKEMEWDKLWKENQKLERKTYPVSDI